MNRTFNPSEVQAIIKKAAALQQEPETGGLTQQELEKLAEESGIAPEAIRKAISDLDKPAISAHSSKSDTHLFEVRDVGPADADAAWPEMVEELRHTFGISFGTVKEDRAKREWVHTSMMGVETRASLSERGRSVRLRLAQRVGAGGQLAEALGYGLGLTGLITFLAVNKLSLGLQDGATLFTTLSVGLTSLIYMADHFWRKSKQKQLTNLADRISQSLALGAPDAAESNPEKTSLSGSVPIKRISLEDVLFDDSQEGKLKNALRNRE